MKALGMIEVDGYIAGVAAADAALKAANVTLIAIEKVNAGITNVQITGDVGAVKAGVDAGVMIADELGMLRASHVIARLHEETLKLFPKLNKSINNEVVKKYSNIEIIKSEVKEEGIGLEKEAQEIIKEAKILDEVTQDIIKETQNIKEKTAEIIKENEEVKEVIKDIMIESKKLEEKNEEDLSNKNQNNNEILVDKTYEGKKQTDLIDYSSMRVDELRKLVRSLNLPHLTNKQIKFEKKEVLINILLEYGRVGEK